MSKTKFALCFGDSNTYGAVPTLARSGRHRFAPERRWPFIASKALGNRWHFIEEGLPSRTTLHADPIEGAHKNGLAALPVCLETHMPLDLVIIMLGTNDLKARFSVSTGDIADSIEALVKFVQKSEAGPSGVAPQILVISPPIIQEVDWLADMFLGGAKKSRELGALISGVCERAGVAFLDAAHIVSPSVVDGIHLDAESHRTLGHSVAEVVNEKFDD